jgi:hypothetical protein
MKSSIMIAGVRGEYLHNKIQKRYRYVNLLDEDLCRELNKVHLCYELPITVAARSKA